MALPVQQTPLYQVEIPSNKQKVKYRPFLIKEEKALMIAQQSEDVTVMVDTLKSVLSECIQEPVDLTKLAVFDLEYLFSQIRGKSVGETVELFFGCESCEDPKNKVKLEIDVTKITPQFHEDHKSKIELFDDVGVMMKYPSIDLLYKLNNVDFEDPEVIFDIVSDCIDFIYDTNEVYHAHEQSKEELNTFLNNLTQVQFDKIKNFFETMPVMEKELEWDCPVCNHHNKQTVRGLQNFF